MGVGETAQATVHREVFFNWAASSRRQPGMLGCLRPAERKADDDFRLWKWGCGGGVRMLHIMNMRKLESPKWRDERTAARGFHGRWSHVTGLRLPLVTDFENIIIFISNTESLAKLQPSAISTPPPPGKINVLCVFVFRVLNFRTV